ncbi:SPOR domain-containing protein [Soonwooa sp.]|uniref:SPOR domain-containing protein n=1 Tax=Soonwooa sp. TaxID=1938592 RepID=UPI002615E4CF|nr:SPOR domain-containing protein [Soonwooa sp.]
MKILTKALLLFIFAVGYKASAQLVVKSDTISGTPVTMTMDTRIDNLISKQEESCARPKGGGFTSTSDDEPVKQPTKIVVPSRTMTNTEVCRQNPKIMGYKIQVAVVKSNEEARTLGADFRKNFPSLKVEIDASLRPNYKVLAGSYFNKQSAASDLSRVKATYGSATAVQYRIFCVEAK